MDCPDPEMPTIGVRELRLRRLPKKVLELYLIVADYVDDEELRGFLKFQLQLQINRIVHEERVVLQTLVRSKEITLNFVLESSYFGSTPNAFFGQIIPLLKDNPLHFYEFRENERRYVQRPQRRRGYHDHGSHRPDHQWIPDIRKTEVNSYQFNLMQEAEDIRKKTYNEDLPDFIEGWVT